MKTPFFCLVGLFATATVGAQAQDWSQPVRGTWVSEDKAEAALTLSEAGRSAGIAVGAAENSAVRQAVWFLAGDIEKISGARPPVAEPSAAAGAVIHVATMGQGALPPEIDQARLRGQWEAYQIVAAGDGLWLVGSDFRGTAFAVYTLCERLGIDPLYLWTGYRPERRTVLRVKKVNLFVPPPVFKYRGMFHDDEDILPRPFEDSGYPYRLGDVPTQWYKKYFETALRLRFNMVAPYTRVHRRYEVQKLASDWGLFYTSHHYDILLSNPFGFVRYHLGEQRHAGTEWSWLTNREGMMNFWRGGLEENDRLNCIWPVGLRGEDDHAYRFPPGTSPAEQSRVFNEVLRAQLSLARQTLPPDKQPGIFQFTLYSEMLDNYQRGTLDVPSNVILVWPDDNDGTMRALPQDLGRWKHGVYYHLAYFGPSVKQNAGTVSPARISEEFAKIIHAGATEYLLFNVSELREFVREARLLSGIAWDGSAAVGSGPPGAKFMRWFGEEYFPSAAPEAAQAYADYFRALASSDDQFYAAGQFHDLIEILSARFSEGRAGPLPPGMRERLQRRAELYRTIMPEFDRARGKMTWQQQQFFFDSLTLPLLFDWRPTQAALRLCDAVDEPDPAKAWRICAEAMAPLEQLEIEILRAEHPPFEQWYRHTWIRRETKAVNVHRSYEELRMLLATGGAGRLVDPEPPHHPSP